MDIDLDAFRRARAEARPADEKPHTIIYRKKRYTLPTEIPLQFSIALVQNDAETALLSILGQKQYEKFRREALLPANPADAMTEIDLIELANQIATLQFGQTKNPQEDGKGESSASGGS